MASEENSSDSSAPTKSFFGNVVAFFGDIAKDVASSLLVVVLTFAFATAISAGMLWYYGWPLFLSPIGGFIVLGIMLVFWYDH